MKETEDLSEFVFTMSLDKIPNKVVELAKGYMLDLIGVAILAKKTAWGQIITDFSLEHGCNGNATMFGVSSKKVSPLLAALANGTCAHGFELDDVHYPSISHPGSVVIPAALALGEQNDISGAKLLESIIVGYEVMCRIGSAISREHLAQGFHPTGTFGVFGAASTCAKILDLNRNQIQDAFGLAGSLASGIMQFSVGGSMVKRIHAGNAAEQGMKASLLAGRGFTGPREILEGKYGFCRVFTKVPEGIEWTRITEGLREKFAIEQISIKPCPACGVLHSVVDCITMINRERKLAVNEIDEIVVLGHENLAHEHSVYRPNSILAAQYSLPFTVGLAVLEKVTNPKIYLDESILADKTVLQIGDRVKTKVTKEIENVFPAKFGAKVVVKFKNGESIIQSVLDPKGSPNNPLSKEELEKKFRSVTEDILDERMATKVIKRIDSIENAKSVRTVLEGIHYSGETC